jgi:hypothetical protein
VSIRIARSMLARLALHYRRHDCVAKDGLAQELYQIHVREFYDRHSLPPVESFDQPNERLVLGRIKVRILLFEKAASSNVYRFPVVNVFRFDQEQPQGLKKVAEGLSFASPLNTAQAAYVLGVF